MLGLEQMYKHILRSSFENVTKALIINEYN